MSVNLIPVGIAQNNVYNNRRLDRNVVGKNYSQPAFKQNSEETVLRPKKKSSDKFKTALRIMGGISLIVSLGLLGVVCHNKKSLDKMAKELETMSKNKDKVAAYEKLKKKYENLDDKQNILDVLSDILILVP